MNPQRSPEKCLINFRLPIELRDNFDYLCSYQSLNRTNVLTSLIIGYIQDQKFIIETPTKLKPLNSATIPQHPKNRREYSRRSKIIENNGDIWETPDEIYSDYHSFQDR
jgi:hypothetical protein